MKKFSGTVVYQGDLAIERIEKLPRDAKDERKREAGALIVGHSETGHHHSIHSKRAKLLGSSDPLICYLQIDGAYAELVHHRPVNPHEAFKLPTGTYRVRRQREWTPEGWRRVED